MKPKTKKSTKTPKTQRFSDETLHQVEWLASRMGGIDATSVHTIAIAEMYERKHHEYKAKVSQIPGTDGHQLSIGNVPIAYFGEKTLEHLPADRRAALEAGNQEDTALAEIVLAGARADEKIMFFPDAIGQLYGPPLDNQEKARGGKSPRSSG
jgi:hypothetical protein